MNCGWRENMLARICRACSLSVRVLPKPCQWKTSIPTLPPLQKKRTLHTRFTIRFAYVDLQEHSGKSRDQLVPELAYVASEVLPEGQRFQGNTHVEAL
jgi:hypothetical protein